MKEPAEAPRLWIKSYQRTDSNPITGRFCRATGLSEPAAIGTLHLLWWFALDWARDGDISRFDEFDIAKALKFDGEPKVLMDALIMADYVTETQTGREITNWYKIGGQLIEDKKKDKERKAEERKNKAAAKASKAPVQRVSAGHPPDKQGTSGSNPPEIQSRDIDRDKEIDSDLEKKSKQQEYPQENQDKNPKPEGETPASSENSTVELPKTGLKRGGKGSARYDDDSPFLKMATYLKLKIDELSKILGVELAPKANLQTWANDLRLMEEQDGHTDRSLSKELMDWLHTSPFWSKNVLSAATFRKQYAKLVLEMRSAKTGGAKSTGGASGGRGGHQKPIIPISDDSNEPPPPSEVEFAEMMRKAAELKAEKIRMKEEGRNR